MTGIAPTGNSNPNQIDWKYDSSAGRWYAFQFVNTSEGAPAPACGEGRRPILKVYESEVGIPNVFAEWRSYEFPYYSHNVAIEGDKSGNFSTAPPLLVGFGGHSRDDASTNPQTGQPFLGCEAPYDVYGFVMDFTP